MQVRASYARFSRFTFYVPVLRAACYVNYEDGMPAGGNSRFRGYPARMSERQQLALLLQMTSQEMVSGKK